MRNVLLYSDGERRTIKLKKDMDLLKKSIFFIGKTMAKIDAMTTCPWINYQPKVPEAVNRLRKDRR